MKEKIKNLKGITLVALVVTIVVLIILATISINIIFGEEGIVERVKQAKQDMANAQVEEQERLAHAANSMEQHIAGERETITIDKEEYETLKSEHESMKTAISELQANQRKVEKAWTTSSERTVAYEWKTIDTISLNNYGKGKAVITYSASNTSDVSLNRFEIGLYVNGSFVATDGDSDTEGLNWRRTSVSTTTDYDENTVIDLKLITSAANTPYYSYSILLLPD